MKLRYFAAVTWRNMPVFYLSQFKWHLCFSCTLLYKCLQHTVPSCFNKYQNNETSAQWNFLFWPPEIYYILWSKLFHLNEYQCNKNISLMQ
jgi:hypothetical protein